MSVEKYPTSDEYYENINKIHNEELNSDRYKNICSFLERKQMQKYNSNYEEELFNIVGRTDLEDQYLYMQQNDIIKDRVSRYYKLTKLLSSLTYDEIDSNIFLSKAKYYLEMAIATSQKILDELLKKNMEDSSSIYQLEIELEEDILFYDYVKTSVGIPYFRPEAYKVSYIDILPKENMEVYKKYNEFVGTMMLLASDIYLLQLSMLLDLSNNPISIHGLHIYSGDERKKIIVHASKLKHSMRSSNEVMEEFMTKLENGDFERTEPSSKGDISLTPEFIDKTIKDFEKLLSSGIVDIIEDKPKQYKIGIKNCKRD